MNTKVMIASIVSNQEPWLMRFLDAIDKLSYPKEKLTYSFLTGNNEDNTYGILDEFRTTHNNATLKRIDINVYNASRYGRLSTLRNLLIFESLEDEDYILFCDSDIIDMPPDLIEQLLSATNADIIAPMVYIENYEKFGDNYFYDKLAFIKDGIHFNHYYPYIPNYKRLPSEPVYVDSVGTCYLCNTKMFRNGVRYEDDGYTSEQIMFCTCARQHNYKICIYPSVSVLHVNFESYGLSFRPLDISDAYIYNGISPTHLKSRNGIEEIGIKRGTSNPALLPNHLYHTNVKLKEVQVEIITLYSRKDYKKVFEGFRYTKYHHRKRRAVIPVRDGIFSVPTEKDNRLTLCFANVEVTKEKMNSF